MKSKQAWIIVAVILVVIVAAAAYLFITGPNQTTVPQANTGNTGQNSTGGMGSTPAPSDSPGAYIDYSPTTFEQTEGRRVLFFHAPWCPQCRALENSIQEQGVPDGMTIFKVDYDSSTQLKQRYEITLQTTVVEVDATGNTITKHVAYDSPSLPAVLTALGN